MKQKPILSEATINAGEKLSPESRKKVETAVASMLALEPSPLLESYSAEKISSACRATPHH
ncbi:MAG: hypothetical protein R3F45_05220 [Gammaproteobacteria bacterium]